MRMQRHNLGGIGRIWMLDADRMSWPKPHLTPQGIELARPVMRSPRCLNTHYAARQPAHEPERLRAAQLPTDYQLTYGPIGLRSCSRRGNYGSRSTPFVLSPRFPLEIFGQHVNPSAKESLSPRRTAGAQAVEEDADEG